MVYWTRTQRKAVDAVTPEQERLLETLYHEHYGRLTVYATAALRDRAHAEDVVQDTFHEAMYHLDVLAHHEAPGGWLLVTLKYKLREYERARRRYLLRFLSLDSELARDPVSPAPPLEEQVGLDERQLLAQIDQTLQPEEYRLLLRLTLDGASHLTVAQELGISVYACQKRLQRVRTKLRRALF